MAETGKAVVDAKLKKVHAWIDLAAFGGLILLIVYTLILHAALIGMDGPLEYREAAIVDTTLLLLEGKHPYQEEVLPVHANVYGISLSGAMALLNPVLPPSLQNHRLISGIFLVLGCLLLVSIAKRSNLQPALAWSVGGFYYVLVGTTYSLAARPDGVGLFLMFACLRLAMVEKGKAGFVPALAGSVALALLSFFAKPYFLFGFGCAGIYLAWRWGIKASIIYGIGFLVAAATAYIVAQITWPLYWVATFEINLMLALRIWETFRNQWIYFFQLHAVWVAVLVFVWIKRPMWKLEPTSRWKVAWSQGVGKCFAADWSEVCALCAAGFLLAGMAWHQGAYAIYFIHLLSPMLLLATYSGLRNWKPTWRQLPFQLSLPSSVTFLQVLILGMFLSPLPHYSGSRNDALLAMFDPEDKVFASPLFLDVMIERGMPYLYNGQTEFLVIQAFVDSEKIPPSLRSAVQKHQHFVTKRIRDRYYDRLILGHTRIPRTLDLELVKQHYEITAVGKRPVYYGNFSDPSRYGECAYDVWIWERKRSRP